MHPEPLILTNFVKFQQMKGDLAVKLLKEQKHLLNRNTRSQATEAWCTFFIAITQEHLARFSLPSSWWVSLKLQGPTIATWFSFPGRLPHPHRTHAHTKAPPSVYRLCLHDTRTFFTEANEAQKANTLYYVSAQIINGCLLAPCVPLVSTKLRSDLHSLQSTFTDESHRVLALGQKEGTSFPSCYRQANGCVKR